MRYHSGQKISLRHLSASYILRPAFANFQFNSPFAGQIMPGTHEAILTEFFNETPVTLSIPSLASLLMVAWRTANQCAPQKQYLDNQCGQSL